MPWIRRGLVIVLIAGLGGTAFYFYQRSRPIQRQDDIRASRPRSPGARDMRADNTTVERHSRTGPPKALQSSGTPSMQHGPVVDNHGRGRREAGQPASVGRPSVQAGSQPIRPAPKPETVAKSRGTGDPIRWQPLKDVAKEGPQPSEAVDIGGAAMSKSTDEKDSSLAYPSPALSVQPMAEPSPPLPDRAEQPAETVYRDASPLTDGRLKIQALAWSPIAEDRMAVINTRIVHVGDKVDGFAVLAIGRDDVIVREKGEIYRLAFGRP